MGFFFLMGEKQTSASLFQLIVSLSMLELLLAVTFFEAVSSQHDLASGCSFFFFFNLL